MLYCIGVNKDRLTAIGYEEISIAKDDEKWFIWAKTEE